MIESLKNIIYLARRFKLATVFNLLGLVVAFAAFYMMMTQVIYQFTYNRSVEDSDRLYRIETDFLNNHGLFNDQVFYPLADVLDSMPDVESYSMIRYIHNDPVYANNYKQEFKTKDGETIEFTYAFSCNKTAVSTLASQSKVLSGNIDWTERENDPYPGRRGVIIPASIAQKYFGKTDVAGDKMMAIWPNDPKQYAWTVRGVYEDFPENSELWNCIYEVMRDDNRDSSKYDLSPSYKCIVKFKQAPNDVNVLNDKTMQAVFDLMEKEGWENYAAKANMSVPRLKQVISDMHIRLTPLTDSYFQSDSHSTGEHGFKPMFVILVLSSLLLIIISAILFLNFALIESPMRIRGINTRMVLGAKRRSLHRGIITECVITAVVACLLALMLCGVLSLWSAVDRLVDGSFALWKHPLLALFTLIISVVVGIVAGLYPSSFILSIAPSMALKGNFGLTPQGHKLRKLSIGFQLFITFLMIIYLSTLFAQKHYIYHSNYGYNKNQVYMSTLPAEASDSVKQVLRQELIALPGIECLSFSDGSMGLSDEHVSQNVEVQGNSIIYDDCFVDTTYMRTMGIKILEGRDFQPGDSAMVIINESAKQRWKWLKVGMTIPSEYSGDVTVIGVCEDIRYNTTRIKSEIPFIFEIAPKSRSCIHLNVRIADKADHEAVRELADSIIQKRLRNISKAETEDDKIAIMTDPFPTPLSAFDNKLEETYASEFRFFKWFLILSIICSLITLIGVLSLTMFEMEYRRKEIGIRKVMGATTGEIIMMLCRQYIPLILISFAVAAPIAVYSGMKTLEYFKGGHTTIPWWLLPVILLIGGGVTLGAVLLQCWRFARENPVYSIKKE